MSTLGYRVPFGALGANGAAMFRSGWSVVVSVARLWSGVASPFYQKLIRSLKGWVRLYRDMSQLAGMSDRELRDLGVNRVVIAAIRARTYRRESTDGKERIVFCPGAGKMVNLVLKDRSSRSLTEEWMISTAPLEWVTARFVLAARVDPDLTRRPVPYERAPLHAGSVARAGWQHSEPATI
ncbi:MAG: DUF1127 domain-containing protein [Acetobacteraceae bacterium]|nr:DUF1127 domain-containing protein [Acetobacteraceae bacterium]